MASYKTVLDVSKYQTVSSWSSVAKEVDGVIIRCGYRGYGSSGTLTKDPKYASFIKGAVEAGIPVSVYFFSQAITEAEAKAEADYTVSLIGDYTMSMPVYIDIEYANSSHNGRADSLGKTARTAVAAAFCKEMEAKGYKAGVYSSDSWFSSMLDQSKLKDYSLWVARYSSSAPQYVSSYDGWQYTSSGSVSGVSGKVDLSKWYGDISASAATASSDTTTAESAAATTATSSTSSNSTTFAAGDKVTLSNTNLYGSSSSSKATTTKSGTYYIWSAAITNGRIRITNSASNVGKAGQITGWVNESDISKASTTTATTTSTTTTSTSSSSSLAAGTKVTLKGVNLYSSASDSKAVTTVTGTYYLWSSETSNGKIRITNTKANVGKSGQITGWISTSVITGTTSSSSSSSSSSKYTAGTKVTLKGVNLYASATSTKASTTKTGTFYLWDGTVTNSRIRITNTKANVGKSGQITGWISTSVI